MSEKIKKNAENINDLAEKVVGGLRDVGSCDSDSAHNTITCEVTYNVCCGRCNTVFYSFTAPRGALISQLAPEFCPKCNSYQTVYAKEAN